MPAHSPTTLAGSVLRIFPVIDYYAQRLLLFGQYDTVRTIEMWMRFITFLTSKEKKKKREADWLRFLPFSVV